MLGYFLFEFYGIAGWASPLKSMKTNRDDEIPKIWKQLEKTTNVSNHHPDKTLKPQDWYTGLWCWSVILLIFLGPWITRFREYSRAGILLDLRRPLEMSEEKSYPETMIVTAPNVRISCFFVIVVIIIIIIIIIQCLESEIKQFGAKKKTNSFIW